MRINPLCKLMLLLSIVVAFSNSWLYGQIKVIPANPITNSDVHFVVEDERLQGTKISWKSESADSAVDEAKESETEGAKLIIKYQSPGSYIVSATFKVDADRVKTIAIGIDVAEESNLLHGTFEPPVLIEAPLPVEAPPVENAQPSVPPSVPQANNPTVTVNNVSDKSFEEYLTNTLKKSAVWRLDPNYPDTLKALSQGYTELLSKTDISTAEQLSKDAVAMRKKVIAKVEGEVARERWEAFFKDSSFEFFVARSHNHNDLNDANLYYQSLSSQFIAEVGRDEERLEEIKELMRTHTAPGGFQGQFRSQFDRNNRNHKRRYGGLLPGIIHALFGYPY